MGADIEKLVASIVEEVINNSKVTVQAKNKIDFISLENAKFLAEKVEAKAKELGVNAVVAIADEGGNLKLCECMDNSYYASRDIAINKAYTSVALKMSTKTLAELAIPGGPLYGIQHTNGGKIVIFGGGDPLELNGKIVGGIGVSGGTAELDTALSAYGKKVFEENFI